jgi:hypothetical protein
VNVTTHPEDRPTTFTLPAGRNWLEPGDTDYRWVLDDLIEHTAINAFLDRIIVHPDYDVPADAVLPTICYGRRNRIALTWCNLIAVFKLRRGEYVVDQRRSDIPQRYVTADERIMVLV